MKASAVWNDIRETASPLFLAMVLCVAAPPAWSVELFFAFPDNQGAGDADVFLTSGVNASGTITNGNGTFIMPFNIAANSTTIVTIPTAQRVTSAGTVSNNGFTIQSDQSIAAYFMSINMPVASNDITNIFPSTSLGTNYRVMAGQTDIVTNGSQLTVVGAADNTTVTITPTQNLTTGQLAGVPFDVILNKGQAVMYYGVSNTDITGTLVTSDKAVAVFGGHKCGNVPGNVSFCDFLIEQIPSTDKFGKEFVILPTQRPSTAGDALKIIADSDGTIVTLTDSGGTNVQLLNAGDIYELNTAGNFVDELTSISSNNPILVGQFMTGTFAQPVDFGDPAFSLIPSSDQWLDEYIFNVPTNYVQDYLGIAIDSVDLASLMLDGALVDSTCFSAVPGTAFVACNIPVLAGSHAISADNPFMLTGHGFDNLRASYFGIGGSRVSGGGLPPPVLPPPTPSVPEPASLLLLSGGLLILSIPGRRRPS